MIKMTVKYEEMLKKAIEKLPSVVENSDRFKIPESEVTYSGKLTIIKNFNQIVNILRRDPNHLAKFLFKELAIPGKIEENKLILQKIFTKEKIDEKIREYCKIYIFCNECGKPDTKLFKKGNIYFIKCEACGAERSVPRV
ncbi:MAG: translation initiation factor IF-2 subunit beta [Candidatus Aenigmatarchaeota archaeon]